MTRMQHKITLILLSGCVTTLFFFVVSRNKRLCKKLTGILVWHVSLHFPRIRNKFIALLFLNLAILKFSPIKSVKYQNLSSEIKLIRKICEKIFGKAQPPAFFVSCVVPFVNYFHSDCSLRNTPFLTATWEGVLCSNSAIFRWGCGSVFMSREN